MYICNVKRSVPMFCHTSVKIQMFLLVVHHRKEIQLAQTDKNSMVVERRAGIYVMDVVCRSRPSELHHLGRETPTGTGVLHVRVQVFEISLLQIKDIVVSTWHLHGQAIHCDWN